MYHLLYYRHRQEKFYFPHFNYWERASRLRLPLFYRSSLAIFTTRPRRNSAAPVLPNKWNTAIGRYKWPCDIFQESDIDAFWMRRIDWHHASVQILEMCWEVGSQGWCGHRWAGAGDMLMIWILATSAMAFRYAQILLCNIVALMSSAHESPDAKVLTRLRLSTALSRIIVAERSAAVDNYHRIDKLLPGIIILNAFFGTRSPSRLWVFCLISPTAKVKRDRHFISSTSAVAIISFISAPVA